MGTFKSKKGTAICENCGKYLVEHEQDEAGYHMCPNSGVR